MATVVPPPSKRQKLDAEKAAQEEKEALQIPPGLGNVRVQFVDQATGRSTGEPLLLPVAQSSVKNLELVLNSLNNQNHGEADKVPYRFSFQSSAADNGKPAPTITEITHTLYHAILKQHKAAHPKTELDPTQVIPSETTIQLHYTPLSVFKVRAATRLSSSIPGHKAAILAASFSPRTSSRLVTGDGTGFAKIIDADTGTPVCDLQGHTGWVLAVAWSPDGELIATGSYDGTVRIWDAESGKELNVLRGHKKWITALAWEPYHLQAPSRPRVASSSKDGSVRVWDAVGGKMDYAFTRHRGSVSCVKWGGAGQIYTTSVDKTVMVVDAATGKLLKCLEKHAHWVNHLALSTDSVLRTGYFDHRGRDRSARGEASDAALQRDRAARAKARWQAAAQFDGQTTERFVTASDDCTMYLWDSSSLGAPVARLMGHQKPVNHVVFSPPPPPSTSTGTATVASGSAGVIASSSFDNSVKLWSARTGQFLRTLRGHVGPVYMSAFSADARLLASCSKDTTVKIWDVATGRLVSDLSGSKDEVFALDWSPSVGEGGDDGKVVSGGKDKVVRVWVA